MADSSLVACKISILDPSRCSPRQSQSICIPSQHSIQKIMLPAQACYSIHNRSLSIPACTINGEPRASFDLETSCAVAATSRSRNAKRSAIRGNRSSLNWNRFFSARRRTVCMVGAAGGDDVESAHWLSKATPYEVLGLEGDCNEEEIKSAFRNRVKEFHPDVYKGTGNAVAITQRLIQAYELLIQQVDHGSFKRKSSDPFEDPECEAENVFVYELSCIGRGCPYSCVERAPGVFQFASDTGCARAVAQGSTGDYAVQLAVGQCPRNCIYYVTPLQREILEQVLQRALEGTIYSNEVVMLENLLARANYENGRYVAPKRKAKLSTEWVDWY